jgi:hypothetical protein
VSIPNSQQQHVELVYNGLVASAGSNSRAMQAIFHYQRTSTVNPLNKTNVISAFITQTRTLLMTCLSLRLTLTNVACRIINDAQDAYKLTTDTHAGLVTGDSMPLTNAAFLLFQTGLRGRSYRGSKHLFPVGESATTVLTDDIFNAAALTYLGNFATAAAANFTDSDGNVWFPVVLSRTLSQLRTNPTTVVANPVTAILVNKRVGTMRHRKVKSTY